MRSRSLAAQHEAAVSRRLELLATDLAAVRERGPDADTSAASWSRHGHTRTRVAPDLGDAVDTSDSADTAADDAFLSRPAPSSARMPGRHASRRGPGYWSWAVADAVRGRVSLGAGQVAVVAVVAVIGLALTCWWLVRSAGHEVVAPTALTTPRAALATPDARAGGGAPGMSPSTGARAKVVVDVAGKVRRPGIAVLRQGARVIDALRAAGGARRGVDLGGLNLARVLNDGEQVVVGQPTVAGPVASASGSTSPVTGLVDINTADETMLESLPEVGPVTAQAIIAWRSQHGGFSSVDQLLDVDGIGDATLAKLAPFVTV
jgi:competence protein ComEA